MRFQTPLDDVLGNPVRLRVLRTMLRSPTQGLTGRELAKLCSASPSQTNAALSGIERAGLVYHEVIGHSHVWRLAKGHLLHGTLERLFADESAAFERLKADLRSATRGLPLSRAVLFGSVARGEEEPTSDIDLYAQVHTLKAKFEVQDALSDHSLEFARRYGNALSALVLTDQEALERANPNLLRSISRDGASVKA